MALTKEERHLRMLVEAVLKLVVEAVEDRYWWDPSRKRQLGWLSGTRTVLASIIEKFNKQDQIGAKI